MIYVLREGDQPVVKFGYSSRRPSKRLSEMQTGNSSDLSIIAMWPGTKAEEDKIKKYFEEENIRGEWFNLSERISNFIKVNLFKWYPLGKTYRHDLIMFWDWVKKQDHINDKEWHKMGQFMEQIANTIEQEEVA